MTLTTKFKKDISTLRAAVNQEIYLDVKNPKLYKKIKRYYDATLKFLEEIIRNVSNRTYQIKNAIEWNRFQAGM